MMETAPGGRPDRGLPPASGTRLMTNSNERKSEVAREAKQGPTGMVSVETRPGSGERQAEHVLTPPPSGGGSPGQANSPPPRPPEKRMPSRSWGTWMLLGGA